MKNYISKLKNKLNKYLMILRRKPEISKTREISTQPIRETKPFDSSSTSLTASAQAKPIVDSLKCPYCFSQRFVRRGFRQKKHEQVQLYLCRDCQKTFTPHLIKGKHYPLEAVFEGISLYNLGYSLEEACRIINVKRQNNFCIGASTLSNWLNEFSSHMPYLRMREYALKKYSPKETVLYATLAHQQLFRYRFHRAKCELIISDDFKHRRFGPLQEFLEMVPTECPHQYFSTGLRASEAPLTFSKKQMIVRAKQNYANKLCQFALQSVKERKQRHETLQKFMLYNDSVTVATEVPVYITKDDLEHMQSQLGFQIYIKNQISNIKNTNQKEKINCPAAEVDRSSDSRSLPKAEATTAEANVAEVVLPKLITGHIDLLQIRNGQIHILDYKAKAEKEQPIEQLTLYAMALSRLTGLRMFEFKCAWFDENDYFEFYPLHVLYKPRKSQRRKKVVTGEGVYLINKIKEKIERIRPI